MVFESTELFATEALKKIAALIIERALLNLDVFPHVLTVFFSCCSAFAVQNPAFRCMQDLQAGPQHQASNQ